MKKLIYVEENFISPDECQRFIDLSLANKGKEMPYGDETRGGDTYLTTVEWKDHTAVYLGGNVDPTPPSPDDEVVNRVNQICKNFDSTANLDYVGVIRWEPGTFMKPHYDDSAKEGIYDLFAALLYLNDDFEGGYTGFKDMEVKPKAGKLLIFSNSQHKHHVTKVIGKRRYALSFWFNTSST